MEHHLKVLKLCEDTVLSCQFSLTVQATEETFEPLQLNTLTWMGGVRIRNCFYLLLSFSISLPPSLSLSLLAPDN